jgi:hypothetical protein
MAVWELALDKVLVMRDSGKLALPLKTHGYLFEIIVTELAKSNAAETRLIAPLQTTQAVKPLSATAQALVNLEARKRKGVSNVVG